ncbi:hypothetical protein AVEN_204720-1 [Araneus ventricosus]|uniref:Uncharacterized protein n=1 Tax=Araneus ventricosus TaxID=182803 RepID=A0A4Y2H3E8_ARAVE|nr:hypothetical protein AVEN_204720-1 [Araneus ventricosus]
MKKIRRTKNPKVLDIMDFVRKVILSTLMLRKEKIKSICLVSISKSVERERMEHIPVKAFLSFLLPQFTSERTGPMFELPQCTSERTGPIFERPQCTSERTGQIFERPQCTS